MDIQKLNKSGRLNEWAGMVSLCRNSGMPVSAWCREHGISPKTYYYRLKRICEAIPETGKPQALPPVEGLLFAEVTPAGRRGNREATVTIRLGSAEVEIRNGAESGTIEAALRALAGIC